MKLPLRTALFWSHLSVAVPAGLIVAVMGATGVTLAFEPQILRWTEAESREIAPPAAGAGRLALDELLARVRAARPDATPATLTIYREATAAVRVGIGRDDGVHVDPYTGAVRELAGRRSRSFLRTMVEWHRWLGTGEEGRAVGRAITGACNAAFLFLALTGLYLWWPRRWTWRTVRPGLWFRRGLAGKARDWNWHNTIGFWSLPVILVITTSGMVISYRWAANLVFALAGESPPASPAGPNAAPPTVAPPVPGARPASLDAIVVTVVREAPAWRTITVRPRSGRDGDSRRGGEPGARDAREPRNDGAPALALTVREEGAWPRSANVQLSLDPFTGAVLRTERFGDYGPGRRLRTWLRFLHTGEALGWPGQAAVALASGGATLMVWTGFALALRRFLRRRRGNQAVADTTAD